MVQLVLAAALLALQATAAQPQAPSPSADPASSQFASETGLLVVAIKAAGTADYELAIRTLQEALAADVDPGRVAAAKGWRVYKATEPDAKGNAIYVHVLLPAVIGFDYRPSLLLDELIKELPAELLSKYADAFAGPPSRLNLLEVAHMATKPPAPPSGNVSPAAPTVKKPGGL